MKYLKKFNQLNEDIEDMSELKPENIDIREYLVDKIKKSLNSTDEDVFKDFIESYLKDSEKNQIEGLINDSDVYEFYLLFRNEIDEILSEINFYDEVPSDLNCFSLYDYIIKGTTKAIKEVILMIKEESD